MDLLIWILFGGVVGWAASLLMGVGGGLVWDIVVGIVGAVIGGYLMSFISAAPVGGYNVYSFVVAVIGACILIAIVRAVRR